MHILRDRRKGKPCIPAPLSPSMCSSAVVVRADRVKEESDVIESSGVHRSLCCVCAGSAKSGHIAE
jgi:hypothetical protein